MSQPVGRGHSYLTHTLAVFEYFYANASQEIYMKVDLALETIQKPFEL